MPPDQDSARERYRQVIHAAHMMIERYAHLASTEAASRVVELDALEDRECADMWREIEKEVKRQLPTK